MAEARGSGMAWLKYGCFGCLGIVAIAVLAAATVGGMAWKRAQSIELEDRVLTQELPAPAATTRSAPVSLDALAADLPGVVQPVADVTPGRVILDLSQAEVEIAPGQAGEPLRVEGRYDTSSYELEEAYESADDGVWTYRVSFRGKRERSIIATLSQMLSGKSARVRVYLPPDHPLSLDINVSQGGTMVNLGGLWLIDTKVEFSMGGLQLNVDEPLHAPLERFSFHGRMGGAQLNSLGNASPRRLDVAYSMGGIEVDLNGKWVQDSEISIDVSMGGGQVNLPENVSVEGPEGHERHVEGAPTLRIDAKGSGEIDYD